MPLISRRFAGDPVLEACLAGTHRMMAPETGPAVQKIQQALLDLGFPLPVHGADSDFGSETGTAVTAYKIAKGLQPSDPVVGPGTMAALDGDFAEEPPPPFTDREEGRSWRARAAEPTLGHLNFTRADELARRAAGRSFSFDAHSAWLPPPFNTAFLQGLTQILEPTGSPSGPGTPAATWGVGPFDFYHCHISLFDPVTPVIPPPDFNDDKAAVGTRLGRLAAAAGSVPGARPHNAIWSAEYGRLVLADGIGAFAGQAASRALAHGTPTRPLIFMWHTFESEVWRSPTIHSDSPRRHWHTTLAPALSPVLPFPFRTADEVRRVTVDLFQISFLISKTGVITMLPGGGMETTCAAGLVYDDVQRITQPVPPPPQP